MPSRSDKDTVLQYNTPLAFLDQSKDRTPPLVHDNDSNAPTAPARRRSWASRRCSHTCAQAASLARSAARRRGGRARARPQHRSRDPARYRLPSWYCSTPRRRRRRHHQHFQLSRLRRSFRRHGAAVAFLAGGGFLRPQSDPIVDARWGRSHRQPRRLAPLILLSHKLLRSYERHIVEGRRCDRSGREIMRKDTTTGV